MDLDLELHRTPGVASGVAPGSPVTLDLTLAIQYFYSAIQGTPFSGLETFFQSLSSSLQPHRFRSPSSQSDASVSGALSTVFSTALAVGYLAQLAGAVWFATVPSLSGRKLPGRWNSIVVRRPQAGDGPDYLVAPSDPRSAAPGSAVWAVEVKGRKQRTTLGSKRFADWRRQAANLALDPPALRLKSWVIAFNYAVDADPSCRPQSALLVDDPILGPRHGEWVPPEISELVIREHLARACLRHDRIDLAEGVRYGTVSAGPDSLPAVYAVRGAPAGRAYFGRFGLRLPGGQVFLLPPWSRDGGSRFHQMYRDGHAGFWLHDAAGRLFVDWNWPSRRARRSEADAALLEVIAALIHGRVRSASLGGVAFYGQDATMVRAAIKTPYGELLNVPQSEEIMHGGAEEEQGSLILLRNGMIVADAARVERIEDRFWQA